MSAGGVTVEGCDLLDVRGKLGVGRNPDRLPMIEVDLCPNWNRDDALPVFFIVRSNYNGETIRRENLTREQVDKHVKSILDKHFARIEAKEREVAQAKAAIIRQQLKDFRKSEAKIKKDIKTLERR